MPKTFCNYTNLLRLFPFPISLSVCLSLLCLVLIYASGIRKNHHRLPTEYFNYASRVGKQLLVKPFLALALSTRPTKMGASEISVELSPETKPSISNAMQTQRVQCDPKAKLEIKPS